MDEPTTVTAKTSIQKVREIFITTNVWAIYVLGDNETPIGVITRRDYHNRMNSSVIMASDIMSPQPYTIDVNADVSTALIKMQELRIGTLAVMENGKFCGVVNRNSNKVRWTAFKHNRAAKSWHRAIIKILLSIIIFVIIAAYFFPNFIELLEYKKCVDNTLTGWCSANKPYFCNDGVLLYDANKCGCPDNQIEKNGVCNPLHNCEDGTVHGTCSTNQPLFCFDGNLSTDAQKCGCPQNYLTEGNICREKRDCIDETEDMQCSANKPKYCYNGSLVEKASKCGCPVGYFSQEEKCTNQDIIDKENAQDAFEYINELRQENGEDPLSWDDRLYELAVFRSRDMFERGYFDHVTPEGKCVKDFKSEYGVEEYTIAENAGGMTHYTDGTPIPSTNMKEPVDAWMNSRGHRYNLLYPEHVAGALGCYRSICVFLGANYNPYGLGAGPCSTGAQGLEYWENAPTQPEEVK